MFAFIKGNLISASPVSVVIETNGVGYKLFIPASLFPKLPQTGNAVLLHTSFIVRELSQALYGFLSVQERDFFEALMGVTGIGPKLALSLIGHMNLIDLHKAIASGDTTAICKVPGIGKKNSERLIIDLRDKAATFLTPADLALTSVGDIRNQKVSDAMSALINLGYNQATAEKALKKTLKSFPESIDLADLITQSLKNV